MQKATHNFVLASQKVPVLHKDGTPLMPCKPAKARKLLRDGKAEKNWTKEGFFYIQLTFDTQPMCLGIDPGSKFDGYAVLTNQEIVTSGMAILPNVTKKQEKRRILRRNRRYRSFGWERRGSRSEGRQEQTTQSSGCLSDQICGGARYMCRIHRRVV